MAGFVGNLIGNADSATKLATARSIWGQSFDGAGNVTGHAMGLGGYIDFQFGDEINRYGGNLYLQHRGDGSRSGTGTGATGNVVMCKNGGNVGIGTHEPAHKLDVNGVLRATAANFGGDIGINIGMTHQNSTEGAYDLIERKSAGGGLYFQYNHNGPILMCNGGGNVLIGTTADSGFKFDSMGNGRFQSGEAGVLSIKRVAEGGAFIDYYSMNQESNLWRVGSSYAYDFIWTFNDSEKLSLSNSGNLTASAFYQSSDRELKTNIKPVENALDYVLDTNYVTFDWKSNGEKSVGIIAQEEKDREFGFLVGHNGENYTYEYAPHVAILGAALKEEHEKVKSLEERIKKLEEIIEKITQQ